MAEQAKPRKLQAPLEIRCIHHQTRTYSAMNIAFLTVLSLLSLWSVLFTINRYGTATPAQRPLICGAALAATAVPVALLMLKAHR